MTGRLTDKVALITGAARGQGRAHAVRMAREGADIIAVDIAGRCHHAYATTRRHPSDLDETARLVEATGGRIIASAVDTRDHDALRDAVDDGVSRASAGWTSSSPTPASQRRRPGTRSPPTRSATSSTST